VTEAPVSAFTPAARVRRIRVSPSSAAAARVRELKAQGRRIFDFTVGEPDFDTPQDVKDAAVAAIARGETKYTPVNGTKELRDAIRDRVEATMGVRYGDEGISVGGGGKQLIYLAFSASLDEGDEVIVPAPYWVSYPDMVLANDGTPVVVPTRAEDGYKLTAETLRSAITERTKWVVLNTPSNPTGATYSRAELEAIAEVVAEAPHVLVLTDEIYADLVYSDAGGRATSLAEVAPGIRDRILTVNGVSKSYAMTGWRLGYAVGAPGIIGAINLLQSQTSSCPSSISQAAAAAALSGDQSFVAHAREVYQARRDRAVELVDAIDGLVPVRPDGAFYLFVDCSALIGRTTPEGAVLETDQDVVLHLLDAAGVAVIQGSAYGTSPFFRMSFATDLDTIEQGIAAIGEAVAALTPAQ